MHKNIVYVVGARAVWNAWRTLQSTYAAQNSLNCNQADGSGSGGGDNPCKQVIVQGTQTLTGASQPPLPITIVGTGLGNWPAGAILSTSHPVCGVTSGGPLPGLPSAMQAPPCIDIQDKTAGWDTATANCQVYLANWNQSSISLMVGLPTGATNYHGTPLAPVDDQTPQSFFQPSPGQTCPIAAGDELVFTVTNPQTAATYPTVHVGASPTGTTPN